MSSRLRRRLAEAVDAAKGGSPLKQVTVVVPNFQAGHDAFRYLARRGGVVNTNFWTVPQIVERLASPALHPRTPLPRPLLEAAVQRVLFDQPGVFADVADQPITAQALANASWRLGSFADPSMDNTPTLVEDMLRVHTTAIRSVSGSHYLPHEAYARRVPFGRPRLHCRVLPQRIRLCGSGIPPTSPDHGRHRRRREESRGTTVVHASDADDEVRSIARLVRRHLADGTPGH